MTVEGEDMADENKKKSDPPDKDKDQVQGGEGFQAAEPEPEPFTGDIEGQKSFDGELSLDDVDPKFRDLIIQKGWKTLGEVADGVKELERQRSEDGRRKRMTEMSPQGMQPQPPYRIPQQGPPEWKPPEDLADVVMDPEKSKQFLRDYENGILSKVQYMQAMQNAAQERGRMTAEINRKQAENPEEFEVLRPYMIRISQGNPNINSLDDLYDMAKEARKTHIKQDVKQGLSEITGGEVDDSRLKTLFSRTKSAGISGASGGGQEGITDPQTRQQREAERIKKEILAAGGPSSD